MTTTTGDTTMASGPGKSHRNGISLMQLAERFPNEDAARDWFEGIAWPDGEMACLKCGSTNAYRVKSGKPQPYRCRDCRSYFSLKTNTALAGSNLTLRQWAYGIYLVVTNLKSVSSMKLHRDLGVTQKTAWFMMHRIRETWGGGNGAAFTGPVEVDESYFGGKRANMSNARRKELEGTGRGPVGKTAVVGVKDRETGQVAARVIERTDGETLRGFVDDHAAPGAALYTDDATAYRGTGRKHEAVKHSAAEYVRYLEGETIHTNGVESFWSMLKRAHKGTFHRLSAKHLQRYVSEFAGRHNIRDLDTIRQMENVAAGLVGRRLLYRDLVADNGLSGAAT
jgi:transposase-like protein